MVKGINLFREHFRAFEGSYILIGGAACDLWFTSQGLTFRATKDLDVVIIVEVTDSKFVAEIRQFVDDGKYEIRERTQGGPPVLYRFAKPGNPDFPSMLELFTRRPEGIYLGGNQEIIPVAAGAEVHSLSAILLDETYYSWIREHHNTEDGLPFANATSLIPLKAHAWLDLTARKQAGDKVDSKDIDKHRSDVFRLAATLPGEAGPSVPDTIRTNLTQFLDAFPEDSPEWPAILASLKQMLGGNVRPPTLREAVITYFQIRQ